MNILFICSRNQWRSPTAERIFSSDAHRTKSAGVSASARIKVTAKLLSWADIIFCMETVHRRRLMERFEDILADKEVIVLEIPDEFQYMNEELIGMLRLSVPPFLDFSNE